MRGKFDALVFVIDVSSEGSNRLHFALTLLAQTMQSMYEDIVLVVLTIADFQDKPVLVLLNKVDLLKQDEKENHRSCYMERNFDNHLEDIIAEMSPYKLRAIVRTSAREYIGLQTGFNWLCNVCQCVNSNKISQVPHIQNGRLRYIFSDVHTEVLDTSYTSVLNSPGTPITLLNKSVTDKTIASPAAESPSVAYVQYHNSL